MMTTGKHAVTTIVFVAIVMTNVVFNAAARDIPAMLADPDAKPPIELGTPFADNAILQMIRSEFSIGRSAD